MPSRLRSRVCARKWDGYFLCSMLLLLTLILTSILFSIRFLISQLLSCSVSLLVFLSSVSLILLILSFTADRPVRSPSFGGISMTWTIKFLGGI